jgi:ribosomal protein S12 methylthiotransferase accessory factor
MQSLDLEESLARLKHLVSPFGVVAAARTAAPIATLPMLTQTTAFLGGGSGIHAADGTIRAFGTSTKGATGAAVAAIAEAAERYAGYGFLDDDSLWATAAELDGPAIDLATLPRCSDREYGDPRCPVRPLDPNARIRWTRGVDLADGHPVWLPTVLTRYGFAHVSKPERFWYRISTGYAVHFDPAEMLLRGICEVIERDAFAGTWLQRMPLPPVDASDLSDDARQLIEWGRRHFIEPYLFDATTDLGVPTAICVAVAPYDDHARQTLGIATGGSIAKGVEKALAEAYLNRGHCFLGKTVPSSPSEFASVEDAIRFMALPDQAEAFGFLVDGAQRRSSRPSVSLPEDPEAALDLLIGRLAAKGWQAVAVDRTTPELAETGLTAATVVIPALLPMTLNAFGQYRGHRRLYELPTLMGFTSHPEQELNPWPLPYA